MPETGSIIWSVLLLIVGLWPGAASGQAPSALMKSIRLAGRVVDFGGATIPTALVTLSFGDFAAETRTDSFGTFIFAAVPAGRHELFVRRTGFKSIHKIVDGEAGKDIDIGDLCLCEILQSGGEPTFPDLELYEVPIPSIPPNVLAMLPQPLEDRSRSIVFSAMMRFLASFGPPGQPIKTTLCDLYQAPMWYAGKMVEVRASISGSREPWLAEIPQSAPCAAYMKIALELPHSVKPAPEFDLVEDASFLAYQDASRQGTSVSATVVGRFDPIFVWRNRKRVRVGEGKGYRKNQVADGRLVLRGISNVLTSRFAP